MIETKRLMIREVKLEDLDSLWRWRNSETFIKMCSTRRTQVTIEDFDRELDYDFSNDRYSTVHN